MRKVWIALILTLFMTILVWAQQKQALSVAGATCTVTGTTCLINSVDQSSGGATFTVTANASGNTLQFEASGDGGTTWVALAVTPSSSSTAVTSTTSTGTWQANMAGYTNVRIRMSTLVSGTSTVSIIFSTAAAFGGSIGGAVSSSLNAAPLTVIQPVYMASRSANNIIGLTQNATLVSSIYIQFPISTVSQLQYGYGTADNTADVYDIGLYGPNCLNGKTNVPLVFHTGPQPGTTLFPGANVPNITVVGAPLTVNMPPGWYCFGFTSSASPAPARLAGGSGVVYPLMFTNGTAPSGGTGVTSGGTLNPTITAPALNATINANIWFTTF